MVTVKIITVSSIMVFLKSKFNNIFHKIKSNDDSYSNFPIPTHKEGEFIITFPKTEHNVLSSNKAKGKHKWNCDSIQASIYAKLVRHRPLFEKVWIFFVNLILITLY